MKTAYLFIVLIILIISVKTYAQEGWFWQNPWPQGNDLHDVQILSNGNIIAVGNNTILTSNDDGNTWNINSHEDIDINSIYFFDDLTGWGCGYGIILGTTNGGISWDTLQAFPNIELIAIEFWDEYNGWIVGSSNSTNEIYLFTTADGGSYWTCDGTISAYSSMTNAHFISPDTGWISNWNDLYKTTDGGVTWDSLGYDSFNTINFVDADTGWASSYLCWWSCAYGIYKTTDGGTTWNEQTNGSGRINALYFIDNSRGWALGTDNLQTNDGGVTWDTIKTVTSASSASMDMAANGTGIIVGEYGSLISTQNGGVLWNIESKLSTTSGLNSVFFTSTNEGWTVGGGYTYGLCGEPDYFGTILKTIDGGSTWIEVDNGGYGGLPGGNILNDVFFVTSDIGWIVATYGNKIFKTSNAGLSWNAFVISNNYHSYHSICFTNPDTGWLAGQDMNQLGIIQKSIDGGSQWQQINIGNCGALNDLVFINSNIGWAIGDKATLLKSENSGSTWTNIPIADSTIDLRAMFFDEVGNGWVAGNDRFSSNNGVVLFKTIDHGITWDSLYISNLGNLTSMWFVNESNGIACGNSIWYTVDGGYTWDKQNINASGNSIFFIDDNTGWIVGSQGTILKTTTGGFSLIDDEIVKKNVIPESIVLNQNYPNPFNPTTTIEFSIPKTGYVALEVYNVLGQEVATLVSDKLTPGNYMYTWDASGFASGIYYYRLSTNKGFVKSRKLIYLK